ncbi:MAG: hypothetical protein E7L00_04830 [Propionibacteriaceae bacterium]|nr:hypothetical protein [Propionibacteriaceae bacterium]
MKKSAWKPLVGVAAVSLLLAGCAHSPNNAALVDGDVVKAEAVTDVKEQCGDYVANVPDGIVAGYVSFGKLLDHDALKDAVPPREQVESVIAQQIPELASKKVCADFIVGQMSFDNALGQLQQTVSPDEFTATLQTLVDEVELNPKYGDLKLSDGKIRIDTGSLSIPANK